MDITGHDPTLTNMIIILINPANQVITVHIIQEEVTPRTGIHQVIMIQIGVRV